MKQRELTVGSDLQKIGQVINKGPLTMVPGAYSVTSLETLQAALCNNLQGSLYRPYKKYALATCPQSG